MSVASGAKSSGADTGAMLAFGRRLKLGNQIQTLLIAALALAASVGIRLVHYNQSFWSDEMGVPLDYARAPWQRVLAARAGEYVPSNHPLHSIVAKLLLTAMGETPAVPPPIHRLEAIARLPSLIAGTLIPLVLALSIYRRSPWAALLVLLAAIVQPWLISGSDEARGYAMMTLLGIIATLLLPDGTNRWPIAYALSIAMMIYTVSVAGILLVAHGATMILLRLPGRSAWVRGALLGGALAALLYLPMMPGLLDYARHPQPTPDSFINFVIQLPSVISAGEHLPLRPALAATAMGMSGFLYWITPVFIVLIGTWCGCRNPALRQLIVAMGTATGLFLLAALVFPGVGQTRFVPWCAVWMVLAVAAIGEYIRRRWGLLALAMFAIPTLGWSTFRSVAMLPCQPIGEAIAQADAMARPGARILVGFLAADDTVELYGRMARHHLVTATAAPAQFLQAERESRQATGQPPWLVMYYEPMVRDTTPRFWEYIQADYELKARLDGRITAVAIYAPRRR